MRVAVLLSVALVVSGVARGGVVNWVGYQDGIGGQQLNPTRASFHHGDQYYNFLPAGSADTVVFDTRVDPQGNGMPTTAVIGNTQSFYQGVGAEPRVAHAGANVNVGQTVIGQGNWTIKLDDDPGVLSHVFPFNPLPTAARTYNSSGSISATGLIIGGTLGRQPVVTPSLPQSGYAGLTNSSLTLTGAGTFQTNRVEIGVGAGSPDLGALYVFNGATLITNSIATGTGFTNAPLNVSSGGRIVSSSGYGYSAGSGDSSVGLNVGNGGTFQAPFMSFSGFSGAQLNGGTLNGNFGLSGVSTNERASLNFSGTSVITGNMRNEGRVRNDGPGKLTVQGNWNESQPFFYSYELSLTFGAENVSLAGEAVPPLIEVIGSASLYSTLRVNGSLTPTGNFYIPLFRAGSFTTYSPNIQLDSYWSSRIRVIRDGNTIAAVPIPEPFTLALTSLYPVMMRRRR